MSIIKKKVLVDLTYIPEGSCAGVVVYAFRLLKILYKIKDYKFVLLVTKENAKYICSRYNNYDVIEIDNNPPISRRLYWFNSIFLLRKINKIVDNLEITLMLSPYINVAGVYTSRIPQVGVVHDMQPFYKFPFVKREVLKLMLLPKIKKLNKIITISNSSKKDILKICGKHYANKIEVVYNSVEYTCYGNLDGVVDIEKPYILYVNTLEEYKNLLTLLRAFNRIKFLIPHNLIIKAKRTSYYDEVIEKEIDKMELQKRVILISDLYSDKEMAALYESASLFVSPSTMEGFGYTPIEAAIHRVPVICTRILALYESTLGMVHYYDDPYNYVELGNMMLELLLKKDNCNYSEIAKVFKDKYSLKKQADTIVKIIDSIII